MEDAVNQPEADYKINVSTSGEILDIEKTQEEPKQEDTVEQEVEATEEVVAETEEVVEDKKEETEESESPQPSREELFNQLLSDKYNMNSEGDPPIGRKDVQGRFWQAASRNADISL